MSSPSPPTDRVEQEYRRGLELIEQGSYFEAHEALEVAWQAAGPVERDFFQGLVHVAVAWYQAGRGNSVGCLRQLDKAIRRLSPYVEVHRGLDVADLLDQLATAEGSYPDLQRPRLRVTTFEEP